MIEETARVVEVGPDGVWVETTRQSSCSSCSSKSGCGTATLGKVMGQKSSRIRVLGELQVEVGDQVVIGINDGALVRGSLAVYMVPLLGLIAGAIFGQWLAVQLEAAPEIGEAVLGSAGLLAGLGWLRIFSRRVSASEDYQPVLLRRVENRVMFHNRPV